MSADANTDGVGGRPTGRPSAVEDDLFGRLTEEEQSTLDGAVAEELSARQLGPAEIVEADEAVLFELFNAALKDRVPAELARKVHFGFLAAEFDERCRERKAAWEAMPRWRQRLAAARAAADGLWWRLTYRLQPLLCRLGIRHLWAPLGEENVLGEVVATDREICSECEKLVQVASGDRV
jgi:hypothetical protein